MVNFEELKALSSNNSYPVSSQRWGNYFAMLPEPVFPIFVKNFWVNASIHFNDENFEEIWFGILNTHIIITHSHITDAIKCEENDANIEWYITKLTFRNEILSITKSSGNPSNASDLTPVENLSTNYHKLCTKGSELTLIVYGCQTSFVFP